jgi:hypothetical protein
MTRPVRMLLPILVGVVLLVACRPHSESIQDDVRPSLGAVAAHLSKASPDETNPLHLSVEAEQPVATVRFAAAHFSNGRRRTASVSGDSPSHYAFCRLPFASQVLEIRASMGRPLGKSLRQIRSAYLLNCQV